MLWITLFGLVAGVRHSLRHSQETSTAEVWIAVKQAGKPTFYFDPVDGRTASAVPHGAVLASVPMATQSAGLLSAGVMRVVRDSPTEDESSNPPGNATTPAPHKKKTALRPVPTLVPHDERHSCVPHCTWRCTNPVCEQQCTPQCSVPRCETRCPKMKAEAYQDCRVRCDEPNCAMYCPSDPCNGTKTLDCNNPKCTTRCTEPHCGLECKNNLGCKTVCQEPSCEWRCRKPKKCATPTCRMVCEQAPECIGHRAEINVEGDVVATRQAVRMQPKWKLGPWSPCSTRCGTGTRNRTVTCNSGHDADCGKSKPAHKEACTETMGCEWQREAWSSCSSRCDEGTQTRKVSCDGPGEDACSHREKPRTEKQCHGHDQTCDLCQVIVYRDPYLGDGANSSRGSPAEFKEGDYSGAELEYRGLKCDSTSSLEVIGKFCQMVAYEYGDFNKAHKGWEAHFKEGRYDVAQMEAAGARDNDLSSFKIRMNKPQKTTTTVTTTRAQFQPMSINRATKRAAADDDDDDDDDVSIDEKVEKAGASVPAVATLMVLAGAWLV
mmetsp:Transcript_36875/g.88762  ORF Transcript_36875/g.88762 Transcript_36875/m.88762 type:complete len:549 (-) Transcript_36875:76-1722(-)